MKKAMNICKLISCIALAMLTAVMVVGTTFSWYDRTQDVDSTKYSSLQYTREGKVNGKAATFATYQGTVDNGKISYAEAPLAENAKVEVPAGEAFYFKTLITNDNYGTSSVALYLDKENPYGNINIGIQSLEKTYKSYKSGDVLCIEDFITMDSQQTVEVYWFVKAESKVTLDLSQMYLVYN